MAGGAGRLAGWKEGYLRRRGANDETVLHLAARYGHAAVISELLNAEGSICGDHPVLRGDRLLGTALHSAVGKRRHAAIEAILAHLSPCPIVDTLVHRNINGRTALHLAVEEQRDPIATALILRAYMYSAVSDSEEAVATAVMVDDLRTAARWAALERPRGWREILRLSIPGGDLPSSDLAVRDGLVASVCIDANDSGHGLVHIVAGEGSEPALAALLDLCMPAHDDPTVGHLGSGMGLIVSVLRRLGAGWGGQEQQADCGALANAPDRNGATPLHHAAGSGARGNARYLMEACGADMFRLDRMQQSAAHWAAAAGHEGLADLLLGWAPD